MEKEYLAAKIFFEAVLPNLPIVIKYYPKIGEKFINKNFVLQLRVQENDFNAVINYKVVNGVFSCNVGQLADKPDIEFCFNNVYNFNSYILGLGSPLPKIKGLLKIGLLKDVLCLLNKFAYIMQSSTPHTDSNDVACQSKILLNVLPVAVRIISNENLTELVVNFSSAANIVIKSNIVGDNDIIPNVILKYAPQNLTQAEVRQDYKLIYESNTQVVDALLNAEFDINMVQNNSTLGIETIKFLINSVNHYARLKFR